MKPKDINRLQVIRKFYAENGILPTYGQITKITGYKSKNASFRLVKRLIEEDYIKKVGSRLAPDINFTKV